MTNTEAEKIYLQALEIAQQENPDNNIVVDLLENASNLGSSDATYALGNWYYYGKDTAVKKNIKKGLELIEKAATSKNWAAMEFLALSYELGDGVEKNERRAFELYLEAAIRGEARAIFEVGRMYWFGIGIDKDQDLAEIWRLRAQELGIKEDEDEIEEDEKICNTKSD